MKAKLRLKKQGNERINGIKLPEFNLLIFSWFVTPCLIALLLLVVFPVMGQESNIDFYKRQLTESDSLEIKREACMELFKEYRKVEKDSALKYAEQGYKYALQIGDSLEIVKLLNAIGYIYKENALYYKGIDYYKKALDIAKHNNYERQIMFMLNNLALSYTLYGKYDLALDYHFQSLKIREDEGDLVSLGVAYNNIGLLYYKIRDYEKALIYFNYSVDVKKKANIEEGLASHYLNLGFTYNGLEQYDKALDAFNKALETCADKCDPKVVIEAYNGFGVAYFSLDSMDTSERYLRKSIKLSTEHNYDLYIMSNYYQLGRLKFETGEYDSALVYAEKCSNLQGFEQTKELAMKLNKLYADIYGKTGESIKAYQHLNEYFAVQDSMLTQDVIRNLANIQLDFQEEKNQQTLTLKDLEISRRKQVNLLMGLIAALVSILAFIMFRNIQLKKRANKRLTEAKIIIESQNRALTDLNTGLENKVRERTQALDASNKALIKSNEELDNFIYRMSHDIRGPLATLQGICNVALLDVKDETSIDYFNKLGLTANRLIEILSKLLTINQINNAVIPATPIDLDTLFAEVKSGFMSERMTAHIEFRGRVGENLAFRSDIELIRIILKNILDNAFKFYNRSERIASFIDVSIDKEAENLKIVVIDNGIGIDSSMSAKIFEIFGKGTESSDSAGIGLYLVKLAIEKLNGTIEYTKTSEDYTCFTVLLPYQREVRAIANRN